MRYFLLALALLILSCDKDEIATQELDTSKLIGRWEGNIENIVYSDGRIEGWDSGQCKNNIFRFYEDGRIWWVDFVKGELPNNCEENQETEPIGTWEIVEGNKLLITLQPSDPDISDVKYIGPLEVRFDEVAVDFVFDELPDGVPSDAVEYYRIYFKDRSEEK